jgi:hypothetical protein
MLLLVLFVFFVLYTLGRLRLRTFRWAYAVCVALGLLYFPASVGFRLNPQPCELTFGVALAVHSLTNYPHIVLFTLFYFLTSALFRVSNWRTFAWAFAATIVMGALVEIGEGVTGKGHCRLRDLIPDAAGALIGAVIVLLWNRVRVRLRPNLGEAY